jgi:hypothetical protein
MDAELIEGKGRKSDEAHIIGLDARLIADVDAHVRASTSARIIPATA